MDAVRADVDALSRRLGRRLTLLVGQPGLDGHSNGAEQIAARARDCGVQVVYDGIRLTPEEIVARARDEKVHAIGLSILSGSHVSLVKEVVAKLAEVGLADIPVIVGGIIPPEDEAALKKAGVARIYTPKDYQITDIVADIVTIVDKSTEAAA